MKLPMNLKWFLLRFVKGENETARVEIGDRIYSPPEISAMVLQKMKQTARRLPWPEIDRGSRYSSCLLNDSQRQATKDAGKIAGLDVKELLTNLPQLRLRTGLIRKRKTKKCCSAQYETSLLKLWDERETRGLEEEGKERVWIYGFVGQSLSQSLLWDWWTVVEVKIRDSKYGVCRVTHLGASANFGSGVMGHEIFFIRLSLQGLAVILRKA